MNSMASLIEQLPAQIARLEAKFGSDSPFVNQLMDQLRASKANAGKTAEEVFTRQATPFENPRSGRGRQCQ